MHRSEIKELPPSVIEKIAAGEVVERPASVVKELVENSVDASARDIRVSFRGGGIESIVVADNGTGIPSEYLELAFKKFTTSKIKSFEDIYKLSSYGFRGEALHSIAAVSKVKIVTATEENVGVEALFVAGKLIYKKEIAAARGTTVEVKDLFFNIPTRRKFLKSKATETKRIFDTAVALALANLKCRFRIDRGKELLTLNPYKEESLDNLEERVRIIYGERSYNDFVAIDTPQLYGIVESFPPRGVRREFIFVNGRWIKNKELSGAFRYAVKSIWGGDKVPSVFVFLKLDPDSIDVNVHPRKLDVKFSSNVLDFFVHSLKKVLREAKRGVTIYLSEIPSTDHRMIDQEDRNTESFPIQRTDFENVLTKSKNVKVGSSGKFGNLLPILDDVNPVSRVVGQIHNSFVVVETRLGVAFIDQHAAHERIWYEEILEERVSKSRFIFPHKLSLTKEDKAELENFKQIFSKLGFDLSVHNNDFYLVSYPSLLDPDMAVEIVYSSLEKGFQTVEELIDVTVANIACKKAIKIGKRLSVQECESLVDKLFRCKEPWRCPHGRAVFVELDINFLLKSFERI